MWNIEKWKFHPSDKENIVNSCSYMRTTIWQFKWGTGRCRYFLIGTTGCRRWVLGFPASFFAKLMGRACSVVLFLIICSMSITLNKALTYGAKKRCLPNHIAQLNAEGCYERQGFKENKAPHPTLFPWVKKLGTLQESSNTQTSRANENVPIRTQHQGTVSLKTYHKMERKASSAICRAKVAEGLARRYWTQLYNANQHATPSN